MILEKPSIAEQYVYNDIEKIMSAGFPITKFIENSNVYKNMIIGGNSQTDKHENISIITNLDKFENLVVPIGLVYNLNNPVKSSQSIDLKMKEKLPKETQEVINEELFNKLLTNVRFFTNYQKQKKSKTKKNQKL
jgi:hypothetical protein